MNLEVTSKNLQGLADLVVSAPIKQGFIDSFQNVTYETRLRLATTTFYKMRQIAREYELIKPFTDVAERIQSLLDFRIGVLDSQPTPSLILAATFDRSLEPYMRLIWHPLGTFLDVLFCNCEGYVTAYDHSFPEYLKWVRDHQVDSMIFYATTPLTVGDQLYLSKLEQAQRALDPAASDPHLAGLTTDDPRVLAASDLHLARLTADDPRALAGRVITRVAAATSRAARGETPTTAEAAADAAVCAQFLTLSIEALTVLYGLADFYPPDRMDGEGRYLLRAAKALFDGWDTKNPLELPPTVRTPYTDMFDWLEQPLMDPLAKTAMRTAAAAPPKFEADQIQRGVIESWDTREAQVWHGCLLLFQVVDAKKTRTFINTQLGAMSFERGPQRNEPFVNLAFTHGGLKNLELADEILKGFPKEFREGADQRAGLVGDIHANHPQRWPLQQRFRNGQGVYCPLVETNEIDLVMQLRTTEDRAGDHDLPNDMQELEGSNHPLAIEVRRLLKTPEASGLRLLSIQPMRRLQAASDASKVQEHFGFMDDVSQPSISQPKVRLSGEATGPDAVALGELVLGYANDRGDPPPDRCRSSDFQKNGSFLVIRKMRQNVAAFEGFIKGEAAAKGIDAADLKAKIVGRTPDGTPLAGSSESDNNFDYANDAGGGKCPLQAHMRRTNPRIPASQDVGGRPIPRIMRRGMSYGPLFRGEPGVDDGVERGSVFMAYNASIAEQYETIQRWINGGDSTGVCAAQNDPLMGVRPLDAPQVFRFPNDRKVERLELPVNQTFVDLQWALYLFTPSHKALKEIVKGPPEPMQIGDAEAGEKLIQMLQMAPVAAAQLGWKEYLEDFLAKDPDELAATPDIWAAIRDKHKGVLRIPQGVLVASRELVRTVFANEEGNYTVEGERPRMRKLFGEIYVGLDKGEDYERESEASNAAIMAVKLADGFAAGYEAASACLAQAFQAAPTAEIDLQRNLITPVLAMVCHQFFGIPASLDPDPENATPQPFIGAGGWNWNPLDQRLPRCPGDFMAPSRFCFYPDPTPAIATYGRAQGRKLYEAAKAHFDALRPLGGPPTGVPGGSLTQAMFDADAYADNDLLARIVIGDMVGALPPIDGALRGVLFDWTNNRDIWRWQQALLEGLNPDTDPAAQCAHADETLGKAMRRSMQKRPAPDLLWRTAKKPHWLADVNVNPGDMVIIGVVSATLEDFNAGGSDVFPMFGENRAAKDPPLHACPGYEMAIGLMLGLLTRLLQCSRIEILPAPLLVRLTR